MIRRLFSFPILFFDTVKHLHQVTQSKASWMSVVMKSRILPQWGGRKKIKHRRKAFLFLQTNKEKKWPFFFLSVSFFLGSCWKSGSYELYFSCDCWILHFALRETFHVWFLIFLTFVKWFHDDFFKIFPEFSAKNLWVTFLTVFSYRSVFKTDEVLGCPMAGLCGQGSI